MFLWATSPCLLSLTAPILCLLVSVQPWRRLRPRSLLRRKSSDRLNLLPPSVVPRPLCLLRPLFPRLSSSRRLFHLISLSLRLSFRLVWLSTLPRIKSCFFSTLSSSRSTRGTWLMLVSVSRRFVSFDSRRRGTQGSEVAREVVSGLQQVVVLCSSFVCLTFCTVVFRKYRFLALYLVFY